MTWCSSSGDGGKDQEPPEFIDTPFYQQTVPSKQIFVTARGAAIAYVDLFLSSLYHFLKSDA